ncbi:14621_t:CDS:1, partial [Dentiscutata erythropus]
VHEQEIKKLKLEFEDTYQQIEEEAVKVIDKMKEEIKEKNKIIDELVERMAYYSIFFGRGFEFAQKQYEQEKLFNQVYTAVNDFTGETYNFVESKEELVENTTQEDKENKEIDIEKLDENDNKEANENKEPEDLSKYNYVYHETFGENSENELYYESDNRSWEYDFDDE